MTDEITLEESFEYSLHNLLEWLEILSLDPIELCSSWGNCNVAWELVSDLKTDGNAAISNPRGYLDAHQKQEVLGFLASLNSIPKSVLNGATSVHANQEAMSHPCWFQVKASALVLLKTLEPAVGKNKAYFARL